MSYVLSLCEENIQLAVRNVFKAYGFGPFDLEAVIAFACRNLDVTPFTYPEVSRVLRDYITAHFECRPGSLRGTGELTFRRMLVYYRE